LATFWNDLKNSAVGGLSLAPAVRTSDGTGSVVDLIDADGGCFAVVQTGTLTDGSHDVKLQETNDSGGGSLTDITGATQAIAATDDNTAFVIGPFTRTKRYVVAFSDVVGATTGGIVGVAVYGMKKSG
jgi:hypothetical protein